MKTKIGIPLTILFLSLVPLVGFAQNKAITNEDIISVWKDYTVRVTCISLDENGLKKSYSDGSGFLIYTSKGISVLTNLHVLYTKGNKLSDYCNVYIPKTNETFKVLKKDRFSGKYQDRATLNIKIASRDLKELMRKSKAVSVDCKEEQLVKDIDIAFIGFPIGSDKTKASSIKGKIVGSEDDYIVSAINIVSGYSGGVAISLKDNCYIGIPTFAKKDDLSKSLILNVNKFK